MCVANGLRFGEFLALMARSLPSLRFTSGKKLPEPQTSLSLCHVNRVPFMTTEVSNPQEPTQQAMCVALSDSWEPAQRAMCTLRFASGRNLPESRT